MKALVLLFAASLSGAAVAAQPINNQTALESTPSATPVNNQTAGYGTSASDTAEDAPEAIDAVASTEDAADLAVNDRKALPCGLFLVSISAGAVGDPCMTQEVVNAEQLAH